MIKKKLTQQDMNYIALGMRFVSCIIVWIKDGRSLDSPNLDRRQAENSCRSADIWTRAILQDIEDD